MVKEHQVPANTTHWLMDSTEDAFYVKAADEFTICQTNDGNAECSKESTAGIYDGGTTEWEI